MATAHTDLSAFDPKKIPSGKGWKIAIVVAEWNKQITENLYLGAEETLVACGVEKMIFSAQMFRVVLNWSLAPKKPWKNKLMRLLLLAV